MIKYLLTSLVFTALFFGCSEQEAAQELTPRPRIDINIDSAQVVLTNEYAFKDGRYGKGAASFLIKGNKDVYLCTAKHLLGEALGISPEVKTSEFDHLLFYWRSFAKDQMHFKDTISSTGIANKKESQVDILLMKAAISNEDVLKLIPSYNKPEVGQSLELIAVQYGKTEQEKYELKLYKHSKGSYIVKADKSFNPSMMSGSPVLDKQGYVLGVLVGGGLFEGELYLTVEPLTRVREYIR